MIKKIGILLFLCSLLAIGCKKEVIDNLDISEPERAHFSKTVLGNGPPCTPIWHDEFDGSSSSPNPNLWYTVDWFRYTYSRNSSSNPNTACDPDNVVKCHTWSYDNSIDNYAISYVDDGAVKIANNELVIESGNDFNTGVVQADFVSGYLKSKDDFLYGYFEIEAKVPVGNILGSAFWLVGNGNEVDIFEIEGFNTDEYPMAIHLDDYSKKLQKTELLNLNLDQGYHKYGLLWKPGVLKWYIDHTLVWKVTGSYWVPSAAQNILLSINMPVQTASEASIVANRDGNNPFGDFQVKYCRVYDKRPTNAYFTSVTSTGGLNEIADYTDWSDEWDIIVPGNFDGTGNQDLLLYDRDLGKAQFISINQEGNISTIIEHTNWRTTWEMIIPGDFDSDNKTDLLLYDKTNGEAQFYNSDGSGQILTGWRRTWKNIVPGNFNNLGNTDLLFYDNTTGEVEVYSLAANGSFTSFNSYSSWRTTWDMLVPGDYDNDNITDVLLYQRNTGEAHFFLSQGNGQHLSGWRKNWDFIVPGNFDNQGNSDLLFYDKDDGLLELYNVNTNAGVSPIKKYTNGRDTWTMIVPGRYDENTISDLLFYGCK